MIVQVQLLDGLVKEDQVHRHQHVYQSVEIVKLLLALKDVMMVTLSTLMAVLVCAR